AALSDCPGTARARRLGPPSGPRRGRDGDDVTRGKARPTQRLDVTLDELRAVRRRIAAEQLAASDLALFHALVLQLGGRAEGREARMLAKVAESAGASPSTSEPPPDPKASDAAVASPTSSSSSSDAAAAGSDEAASLAPGNEGEGDG